jgi:hypothetical protein
MLSGFAASARRARPGFLHVANQFRHFKSARSIPNALEALRLLFLGRASLTSRKPMSYLPPDLAPEMLASAGQIHSTPRLNTKSS